MISLLWTSKKWEKKRLFVKQFPISVSYLYCVHYYSWTLTVRHTVFYLPWWYICFYDAHTQVPQLQLTERILMFQVPEHPISAPPVLRHSRSWATSGVKHCSTDLNVQNSKHKRLSARSGQVFSSQATPSSRIGARSPILSTSRKKNPRVWKCSEKLLR